MVFVSEVFGFCSTEKRPNVGFIAKLFIKIIFFCKKIAISFAVKEKRLTFALAIGLWCNGNTTDSGPVIHGSSPCNPTKKADVNRPFCFFTPLLWSPSFETLALVVVFFV